MRGVPPWVVNMSVLILYLHFANTGLYRNHTKFDIFLL